MKKRKQPEENGYSLVRLNSRITRFDGGDGGGDGGDGGSDGADGGFGSESAGMSAAEAAGLASFGADVSGFSADSGGGGFGGGFGGSGHYESYGPMRADDSASTAPQYSLDNYVPQNMERQFYQPIYRPQYTDYRTGISSLVQQPQPDIFQFDPQLYQPNYGISSLPQSYSSAMPFQGQQFASYGLPFSGYNFPVYSGGGILSLVR